MGLAGIVGSFLPKELLTAAGAAPTNMPVVVVQLHAAVLFGFAMVNWMARGSLLGGIYNRPLVVGNVAHFVVGALASSKAFVEGERTTFVIVVSAIYVAFAVAFALVLLRSPVSAKS
jgi:hypothetical protein